MCGCVHVCERVFACSVYACVVSAYMCVGLHVHSVHASVLYVGTCVRMQCSLCLFAMILRVPSPLNCTLCEDECSSFRATSATPLSKSFIRFSTEEGDSGIQTDRLTDNTRGVNS